MVSATGLVGLLAEAGKDPAAVGKLHEDKREIKKKVSIRAETDRFSNLGFISMMSPIKRATLYSRRSNSLSINLL